ncbi:MAG: carbamoylphosphate synthase large subunit short form, partial [Lachnospiraceae bacterium]|nr:carbamoylphosphate synthase large subunit short form [Lachnospiraceae bacterium]
IKIILLTRHETDHDDTVEENMLSHSITPKLFHQIIKLEGFQKKKDYIRPDGSIFIDNSYQERKEVHDAFEIPVFDVEGIEVLDDWRC